MREAAAAVGLPLDASATLVARYAELAPWPEAHEVLHTLQGRLPLAVVTNCSENLGRIAAACTGCRFDAVVTAERAGFYKPRPQPYRLALDELGFAPGECLFVAGSAYDLFGAAAVGLPVFWHNRTGMAAPPDAPPALAEHRTLRPLIPAVLG